MEKEKKKQKTILVQLNSVILGSVTTGSARDLQIAEEAEEKLKLNFTKKQKFTFWKSGKSPSDQIHPI